MPRARITAHVRFTKSTAIRNTKLLSVLKYMEENGEMSPKDIASYLGASLTTGRDIITAFLELNLVKFCRHDTSGVTTGAGVRVYRAIEGAYEKALKLFPISLGTPETTQALLHRPDGQHLMADDYRTPMKPTVVKVARDPLVACICGTGRAPSLNFIDSADGG